MTGAGGGVIPPSAVHAVRDPALRGQPALVYIYLLGELHPQEWRYVKIHSIRQSLRISARGVVASLQLLVRAGYLRRERDPASAGGRYRYLPVWDGPPRVSPTAPPQAA